MSFARLKWKLKEFRCTIRNYFQRAKKGYCSTDLWDMDNWFLNIYQDNLYQR